MSTVSRYSNLANHLFPLVALIFLQLLLKCSAQTQTGLTRGSELNTSSYLISNSGDFAFGFQPFNKTHFLLAIWFNRTFSQPIIWFATIAEDPVLVTSSARLMLVSQGRLSLLGSNWDPGVIDANSASLSDEGNFVLKDDSNNPVWQSFDHPTDTIVPGQTLRNGSRLWSKLTESDFSKGRFTLEVQQDGNLVLYPLSLITFGTYSAIWASNTLHDYQECKHNSNGSMVPSFLLDFNSNGLLSLNVCTNTSNVMGSPNYPSTDYYQHATLDPDGIFREYIYPKKSVDNKYWEIAGRLPLTNCTTCGFNAYCNSSNNGNQTRLDNCECPRGYSFVNQERKYEGCMPGFATPDHCTDYRAEDFNVTKMPNTDWPGTESYETITPVSAENDCIRYCLNDCSCMVAVFDKNQSTCWKKSLPLQSGRYGTDINLTAFIKVANKRKKKNILKLLGSTGGLILLGSIIVALALLSITVFLFIWKRARMNSKILAIKPRAFSYKEIQRATRGFREVIGQGGFGIVYRGLLESEPHLEIAVKTLEIKKDGEREFKSEVQSIGQANHKNLVKMLGFCYEGKHRMLVYEFMSMGNLANFIFGETRIRWNKRADIAVGIAKGLQYLHDECSFQVIHCDIKPQNILLDQNFLPKISDFGVAKLLKADQTRTSTFVRGTAGYLAPEWFQECEITAKVDVYSFGIVLLELVCCKRSVQQQASECLAAHSCKQLVEDDEEAMADIGRVELFIKVALSCIEQSPASRPTMRQVAQALADETNFSVELSPIIKSSAFQIDVSNYQGADVNHSLQTI